MSNSCQLQQSSFKLFIDPGHGGSDPGAIGNQLNEKDLTLKIAQSIQNYLKQYKHVQTKLSRTKDQTLSLKERTDLANSWKADYFVSVHINSFSQASANGFETFVYPQTTKNNKHKQRIIHQEIMNSFPKGIRDRGKKTANFHVLRQSKMEAILIEYLFISNTKEAKLLKKQSMIDKLGKHTAIGILKAHKLI